MRALHTEVSGQSLQLERKVTASEATVKVRPHHPDPTALRHLPDAVCAPLLSSHHPPRPAGISNARQRRPSLSCRRPASWLLAACRPSSTRARFAPRLANAFMLNAGGAGRRGGWAGLHTRGAEGAGGPLGCRQCDRPRGRAPTGLCFYGRAAWVDFARPHGLPCRGPEPAQPP